MIELAHHILGETSEPILLESSDDNRMAAIALAQQAKRRIDIFTHDLDKRVFDDKAFVEAVKQLVIGHSRALVRVLVQDSTHAAKQGHRLFHLGQEVTSKIKFHQPSREHIDHHGTFMLVDDAGFSQRRTHERYTGNASFNDSQKVRELQSFFERAWNLSEPDAYLKRLSI